MYFLCDKLNAILYITTSAEEQYTFLCLCMSAWNMNINSSFLHDPHIIENLQCNPNKLTVFTLNCFVYQIHNFFEKLWPSVNLPDLMSIIHYKFYSNSLCLLLLKPTALMMGTALYQIFCVCLFTFLFLFRPWLLSVIIMLYFYSIYRMTRQHLTNFIFANFDRLHIYTKSLLNM